MKIQDITEKLEEDYFNFRLCNQVSKPELDKLKQFIQSSITSLLDSIKGECNKVSSDGDTEWADGYNTKNQEVINIINSHK